MFSERERERERERDDLETALGAVVPDEADIGRVNTCSNEHVQILVHNVFQLFI